MVDSASRIEELEIVIAELLKLHDGWHYQHCDDTDIATSDSDYDQPCNRPHERDCGCGAVGIRLRAKQVLQNRLEMPDEVFWSKMANIRETLGYQKGKIEAIEEQATKLLGSGIRR